MGATIISLRCRERASAGAKRGQTKQGASRLPPRRGHEQCKTSSSARDSMCDVTHFVRTDKPTHLLLLQQLRFEVAAAKLLLGVLAKRAPLQHSMCSNVSRRELVPFAVIAVAARVGAAHRRVERRLHSLVFGRLSVRSGKHTKQDKKHPRVQSSEYHPLRACLNFLPRPFPPVGASRAF